MKKIFAALLAVLFITGAVLGCSKTPQTELNQAKQQAAEQVRKTAKSGLEQLQEKQARTKVEEGRAYTGKAEVALYIHTLALKNCIKEAADENSNFGTGQDAVDQAAA